MTEIVESLCTCKTGHSPINDRDNITGIKIYLLAWQENIDEEFRVFVYQNQITAISQQHLYRVHERLQMLAKIKDDVHSQINQWTQQIQHYFSTCIRPRLEQKSALVYCIDFAIWLNLFGPSYNLSIEGLDVTKAITEVIPIVHLMRPVSQLSAAVSAVRTYVVCIYPIRNDSCSTVPYDVYEQFRLTVSGDLIELYSGRALVSNIRDEHSLDR